MVARSATALDNRIILGSPFRGLLGGEPTVTTARDYRGSITTMEGRCPGENLTFRGVPNVLQDGRQAHLRREFDFVCLRKSYSGATSITPTHIRSTKLDPTLSRAHVWFVSYGTHLACQSTASGPLSRTSRSLASGRPSPRRWSLPRHHEGAPCSECLGYRLRQRRQVKAVAVSQFGVGFT